MPVFLGTLFLLVLFQPFILAAESTKPLSSSKAVKLVRKYLSETDPAQKQQLLEEAAHTPASFKIMRKAMVQRSYPGMKPGIHKSLTFEVPTAVSARPVQYAIKVPAQYKPNKLWPLVLGLHGGGNNTGSGDQHMAAVGVYIQDAIVVCPTSVDLGVQFYWRNPKNEAMLDLLIKK